MAKGNPSIELVSQLSDFSSEVISEQSVSAGAYVDSSVILGDQGIFWVSIVETSTGVAQAGIQAIITRKSTGTVVQQLSAGTAITLSCDSGTSYKVRFTNPTGGTLYMFAQIHKLR